MVEVAGRQSAPIHTDNEARHRHGQRTDRLGLSDARSKILEVVTRRVSSNGRASASQAEDAGSIPVTRSNTRPIATYAGLRQTPCAGQLLP